MSQSASLYEIFEDTFKKIFESKYNSDFDCASLAKSSSTFQGTFMALEFILSKEKNEESKVLISEIFNPSQKFWEDDFKKMTEEEQLEFYANGGFTFFLNENTVSKLAALIDEISELEVRNKYSSKELNENDIYPYVWSEGNSLSEAYNENHLVSDFINLKEFLIRASRNKSYVIVFVG
jgi:hypothetical protein